MLAVIAVSIARLRDLFAAVMLAGIYGLLSASFFVSVDAVDVAFTEAAVGAGVFPLLMLTALALVGRHEKTAHRRPLLSLVLVSLTGAMLVLGTLDMPAFGSADAPAHQHVAVRYIEDSPEEIGIPNMVTSVLADYRAYDTLGEVVVIFTAAMGVMALLSSARADSAGSVQATMREHRVLRVVSKMLIPMILLFALYVQFHGEYGPGGGFQAGVIFAAGIILYAMLFGLSNTQRLIRPGLLQMLAACGVLIFGCVGVASLLGGGDFLDYSQLLENTLAGRHLGILLIELGVGITVAAAMILIFYAFASAAASEGENAR